MPPIATPARDGDTNAARVATARDGGLHQTLQEILDDCIAEAPIYAEAYQVTPANADVALISSAVVSGNLSVGVNTVLGQGETHCAELAGAVGAGDVTAILQDALGRYTTISEVQDATTHDPVLHDATPGGFLVYAAWQCANGTADGAAIGAAAAENLQVSFFYFAADGTPTLTPVNQAVRLGRIPMMNPKWQPRYRGTGGRGSDVAGAAAEYTTLDRAWTVSNDFAAGEDFNIDTGAGAGTGTSTAHAAPYADTLTMAASAALFLADDNWTLFYNGKEVIRSNIVWIDTKTFNVNWEFDIGDVILLRQRVKI